MYHIYTVWDTLIKFHMYVYIPTESSNPMVPIEARKPFWASLDVLRAPKSGISSG